MQWIEELASDLGYAVRLLRRSPGFTAMAVASLALGIGANTAIFTLLNAVMVRPLPVRSPDELVTVGDASRPTALREGGPMLDILSYPLYQRLRDHNRVFTGLLERHSGPEPTHRQQPVGVRPLESRMAGVHLGLHGHGDPHVGRAPDDVARETARPDAHDTEERPVQPDALSEDPEVAAKTALPEVVADDDDGTAPRHPFILAGKSAAQPGRHAEHFEVVAGDEPAPNRLHRAALGDHLDSSGTSGGEQAREHAIVIAQPLVQRIGQDVEHRPAFPERGRT